MTAARSWRALGVLRLAVGAAALVASLRADGTRLPRGLLGAARVLAVRDLVQGALLAGAAATDDGASRVGRTGRVVDVLHAASMVPVVALAPGYRRWAAMSAGAALTWAVAQSALLRRSRIQR